MAKARAWIYCRVSEHGDKQLLDYQEKILNNIAMKYGFRIIGITKERAHGKDINSYGCRSMINSIRRDRVEVILSINTKRICIYDDIFEEFEMLCNRKGVVIMTAQHASPSM